MFDCDFQEASFFESCLKKVDFQNNHFENSDFFKISHQQLNLSSCFIDGLTIDIESLKNLIVNSYQALQLVKVLGIQIKDE